jgi:hypothetical protein
MIDDKDLTNQELATMISEMKEENKSLVILHEDEIKYLREMISDRKAVSRVWSKFRMFLLAFAAMIIAWGTVLEHVKDFFKKLLS